MNKDFKITWEQTLYMTALLLSGYLPLAAVVQIPKDKVNYSEDMLFWAAGLANFILLLLMAFNQFGSKIVSNLTILFVVITVLLSAWLLLGTLQQGQMNMENIFYFTMVIAPIFFGIRYLLRWKSSYLSRA